MIKKLMAALLALSLLFALTACGENGNSDIVPEETTSYIREIKTKIAAPEGPYGFGLAKISTDRTYAYDTRYCDKLTDIADLIRKGETDIAALPIELAASLYNETNGAIQVLSVNNLGMFHVIENGKTLKTVSDLNGKTVYTSGEGTPTDFFVKYILDANGVRSADVKYIESWEKLVEQAVAGNADICIVPEPYLTEILARTNPVQSTESTTAKEVDENKVIFARPVDLNKEWEAAAEYKLAQCVVVARKEYIEANPDIISEFMMFNEISVNYLTASAEGSAVYFTEIGFYERADAAQAAITCSNPVFLEGAEMKEAVSKVLEFLFNADPSFIGGKIPDDGFYYGIK